ncbi:hypothetical protein TSUD_122570 [Trifolium subterraneum]|nr:hypothetical protein TSUD_122570 [Trifolium subterraneum]
MLIYSAHLQLCPRMVQHIVTFPALNASLIAAPPHGNKDNIVKIMSAALCLCSVAL